MLKKNILITGPPRVGKTTLIKKIAERLKGYSPAGFYTEEVRGDRGERIGFDIVNICNQQRGVLARVSRKGPYRVGKYSVYLKEFEEFIKGMDIDSASGIVIIDEIGKMECFSDLFREMIEKLIESERILIATVALKGGGLIQSVKERKDIDLYHVTLDTRDSLTDEIEKRVILLMGSTE